MDTLDAQSPSDAPWTPRASPYVIAASVMLATFMEVLDTTVTNVALPHVAGNLSATPEEATWMLTSYLVANAAVLPATGWLGRRFGRKRFLLGCIVVFTLASGLCGTARSLPFLVFARVLQGAGGGALQPMAQAILLESFPPSKRGLAMAIFGLGVVVAPIIGPTLGGWITDQYSWRWIFYINLPVGVLAVLMVNTFIEDPPYLRQSRPATVDYIGFGLLVIWVASLQIVLDRGQQHDWMASRSIRVLTVMAAVGFALFVVWELGTRSPIVDLSVLKDRNFATGISMMTVLGAVLYGTIALVPLFLQTLMGYSALQSGLAISPRGFGALAMMVLLGRIIGIVDTRLLLGFGFGALGYSTLLFSQFNLQIAPRNIIWPNVLSGVAAAGIFVPLTTLAMGTLRNEQMGNATGIFNLMRNLGGSVGIAIVATVLSRGAQVHQATMVAHVTPYDVAYRRQVSLVERGIRPSAGRAEAARKTQAILYGQVGRQARLLTFMDIFRNLAAMCFLCLGALFLFRAPMKRAGPAALH